MTTYKYIIRYVYFLFFHLFAFLPFSASAQTSDSLIVQTLRESNIRFSHDNSVTLLLSGQQ